VNQGVRITPQNVSFVTALTAALRATSALYSAWPAAPPPMATAWLKSMPATIAAMEVLIDLTQLTASHRVGWPSSRPGPELLPAAHVSIYLDGAHQATVARSDAGMFVRADEPLLFRPASTMRCRRRHPVPNPL
jgi:hypothetical protein